MKINKDKKELLQMLTDDLQKHIQTLFDASGKKINKNQAKNMLVNIAMFIIKNNLY